MATLADKNIYLTLDSVDVSAYFVALELTLASDPLDVTGGATAAYVQRAATLTDAHLSLTLAYDADDVGSYLATVRPGKVISVVYGAQGNATSTPKHAGAFMVRRVKHGRSTDKARVALEIEALGADAPTSDMFAGAVFT